MNWCSSARKGIPVLWMAKCLRSPIFCAWSMSYRTMDRKIRAQKIPWPGDFNPQSQSVGQGDDHRSLPRIRSRYNRLRFESCGWCWKVPGRANGIRPLIILGNCEANHQIHTDVFLQVLPQSNSGDQKRVMFFNVFRWIQTNISADADQNMSTVADSCFIPWTAILQSSNRGREIISKVLLDHSSTVLKAVSMVRRKRKVLGSMLCWFLSQSCNRIKQNYTRKLGRPKAARSIRSMGPQIKQIKEIKRSSVRRVDGHMDFPWKKIHDITVGDLRARPQSHLLGWERTLPESRHQRHQVLGSEVIPKPTWKMPPFSNQIISSEKICLMKNQAT